ncbi:MAG: hypothetical protein ACRD45_00275, partial [Bryobacteraceae bacterium]
TPCHAGGAYASGSVSRSSVFGFQASWEIGPGRLGLGFALEFEGIPREFAVAAAQFINLPL